jgi:hypothetical protein
MKRLTLAMILWVVLSVTATRPVVWLSGGITPGAPRVLQAATAKGASAPLLDSRSSGRDGYAWTMYTASEKNVYLAGYRDGVSGMYLGMNEAISAKTALHNQSVGIVFDTMSHTIVRAMDHISIQEMIPELDKLYSDRINQNLPISESIRYAQAKLSGEASAPRLLGDLRKDHR